MWIAHEFDMERAWHSKVPGTVLGPSAKGLLQANALPVCVMHRLCKWRVLRYKRYPAAAGCFCPSCSSTDEQACARFISPNWLWA